MDEYGMKKSLMMMMLLVTLFLVLKHAEDLLLLPFSAPHSAPSLHPFSLLPRLLFFLQMQIIIINDEWRELMRGEKKKKKKKKKKKDNRNTGRIVKFWNIPRLKRNLACSKLHGSTEDP
jgi:hypothetical protein